jgi:hypothetical protein
MLTTAKKSSPVCLGLGDEKPPDPQVLYANEIERLLAEQGGWRDATMRRSR